MGAWRVLYGRERGGSWPPGGGLPGGLRIWGSSRRNLKAARVLEGGYSSLESSNLCGEGSDQSL